MKKPGQSSAEFVVCINNAEYPASLELHKIYRMVPDADAAADGDIRIVDESGEDYLYPACNFSPSKYLKRWKNPCFEPPDSEPEKREKHGALHS